MGQHARARRARGGGRRARRNARAKVALGRDARQRLWRRPERDAAARARQHRRHAGGADRRADAGGGRDGPRPSRLRLAQQRRRADARADPGEPVGARDGGAEPAADGRRPRRALPSERVQGAQAARLLRAHPHAGAQAPRHADPCRGRDAALPDPVGAARRGRADGHARHAGEPAVCQAGGLPVLCAAAQGGRGDRGHDGRGGARAEDHEAAAQGQERHAADAEAGAAPAHRQGARVWRGAPLQPDPAAAHVADARGPGAPPAGQGDRPHSVQARRPGAPLCAQDPRRD
mmetsp:Transcript_5674/g.16488  ORF Transcript_5674/g.16488 Transcript_5674/m.16488 type:complete len:290 (+) Transcript_5674:411-1280(+)